LQSESPYGLLEQYMVKKLISILILFSIYIYVYDVKANSISIINENPLDTTNQIAKQDQTNSLYTSSSPFNSGNDSILLQIELEIENLNSEERYNEALSKITSTYIDNQNNAEQIVDNLLNSNKILTDSFFSSQLYMTKGEIETINGNEKEAKHFLETALDLTPKDSLYYLGYLHGLMSVVYYYEGKFIKSLRHAEISYEYHEKCQDSLNMYYAQNSIGDILHSNGMYNEALSIFEEVTPHLAYLDIDAHVQNLLEIADINHTTGNYDQRDHYFELLKAKSKEPHDLSEEVFLESQLGLMEHFSFLDLTDSINLYWKRIKHLENQDSEFVQFNNKLLRAKSIYLEHNDKTTEAIKALQDILKTKMLSDYFETELSVYLNLSKLYKKIGNHEESLKYLKLNYEMDDSIYSSKKVTTLLYKKTLFDTKLKKQQIQLKNTELKMLKQKRNQSNILILFLFGGSILTVIAAKTIRGRAKINSKKRKQQNFISQTLQKTEEQKRIISEDIHDGIGQNLIFLKNKLSKERLPDIEKEISNIISDVRHVTQSLHPLQYEQLGLTRAILATLNTIHESSYIYVSHQIENIDKLLDKALGLQLFRLIQEIILTKTDSEEVLGLRVTIFQTSSFSIKLDIISNRLTDTLEQNKIEKLTIERLKILDGNISINTNGNTENITINIPIKKLPTHLQLSKTK